MDDCSWMYRDSPQGLRVMDYCNGVKGFINFTTSIPIIFFQIYLPNIINTCCHHNFIEVR